MKDTTRKGLWNEETQKWGPINPPIFIETVVVIVMAIVLLFFQYGSIDYKVLLSFHALFTIVASLCVWFANRFALGKILQSRIESDKITPNLPFELIAVAVLVTSIIYIIAYLIFSYLEGLSFVLADFLQGWLLTIGLSLLIVMFYVGSQIWKSWWSDGAFLFQVKEKAQGKDDPIDTITIKNSKGTFSLDLQKVLYFISASKIAFLVDSSGKKWITQYTLSELEEILDNRFFRLNRRILVSRPVISKIKKLPNHRLLVTIDQPNESHEETISRYKSTKFKQWFDSSAEHA